MLVNCLNILVAKILFFYTTGPVAGYALTRIQHRIVGFVGVLLMALGHVLLAFAPNKHITISSIPLEECKCIVFLRILLYTYFYKLL